jgi:hypothetical protein
MQKAKNNFSFSSHKILFIQRKNTQQNKERESHQVSSNKVKNRCMKHENDDDQDGDDDRD